MSNSTYPSLQCVLYIKLLPIFILRNVLGKENRLEICIHDAKFVVH